MVFYLVKEIRRYAGASCFGELPPVKLVRIADIGMKCLAKNFGDDSVVGLRLALVAANLPHYVLLLVINLIIQKNSTELWGKN